MKEKSNGLHLQIKKQPDNKKKLSWMDGLCLALLNCGGALLLINACPSVTFPWWGCALITMALGLGLLWLYGQRFGGWILPVGVLGLLLLCLVLHSRVMEGLYVLVNDVQLQIVARFGKILLDFSPADPKNLFWGLVPVLLCWTLLISRSIWLGRPWMALPVLLPILVGAFTQVTSTGAGLGLILLGCILLLMVSRPGGLPWGQLAAVVFACAVSILLGLLLGQKLSDGGMEKLERWVHDVRFHREALVMPEGNLSNLPARNENEDAALEITMEEPEKLYLRGTIYETYTGTAWKPAETEKQAEYENLYYWLHESGFYGQTQIGLTEQLTGQQPKNMQLRVIGACAGHGYYPYAAAGTQNFDAKRIGDAELPMEETVGYYTGSVPRWYELQQTLVDGQDTTAISGYLAVEQEYAQYVEKMDLQMTQTSWEVLNRHMDQEDSGKTLAEIREIIRNYLDEAIQYDESVKTANGKADFLQYVLESSGSGYDVHYATAATLLLRYFGVPARYVEGYFLSADEASKLANGETVTLDENHAHAWAEYYLNGVGFVPFEVTPGYVDNEEYELGGSQQPEYVYDGNQMKYAQVERPEEISELKQDPFVFSLNPLLLLWLLPLAILALVLLLVLRRQKFKKAMERIDRADNREAIALRYGYARCLLRHSSVSRPEGAEKAARLNELALFSAREMSGEQRKEMDGYASTVLEACKEKWTLSQKLRYKLWECLY